MNLEDVAKEYGAVSTDKINETLQKYELLLNDTRSPIYSAIRLMGNTSEKDIDSMLESV